MERKKSLVNRIYDTYYRLQDVVLQWFIELVDDEYTYLTRAYAYKIIAALTGIFSVLVIFKRAEKNLFLRILFAPVKLVLGITLAGIFLLVFVFLAMVLGAFAGMLGLRNLTEYRSREQLAAWVIVPIILGLAPVLFSEFIVSKIQAVLVYSIILVGYCFLYGQCGIISLGQSTFVFLGAYFTAWFNLGTFFTALPILPSVFLSGFCTGVVGILLGLPSLRVRDNYLVVITLIFAALIPKFFRSKYLAEYSNSAAGGLLLTSSGPPKIFSFLSSSNWTYFLILISSLFLIFIAHNIIHNSQIGRALRIIKCDVEVSTILGVPVFRYKLLAFALSAFYSGCAGGLFFLFMGSISPESFGFQESLDYVSASVIGGAEGLLGSVIGGIYLTLETDIMRKLSSIYPNGEHLMRAFSGVVLIVMIYLFPNGVAGRLSSWAKRRMSGPRFRGVNRIFPAPDYDFMNQRRPSPTVEDKSL